MFECLRRILPITMLVGLLSGCAHTPSVPSVPSVPPMAPVECPPPQPAALQPAIAAPTPLQELLRESAQWRTLPAAALLDRYEKARGQVQQSATEENRLRMALLWLLPNTTFHDSASAYATLRDLSAGRVTGDAELDAFAAALLLVADEGQHTADDLTQRLHEQQKRADALQEKVDAIRNMERELMRRISP